jgi:nicotinate-nucleotide adenylyltransferase
VALYGGSFDPPHVGHVFASAYALSVLGAAEVWWTPVGAHAFASKSQLAPFEHRVAMCRLAAAPFGANAQVLDLEGHRPGPSYTIDTVEELVASHPHLRFRLLLGADSLPNLPKWRRVDDLARLAPFWVVGRESYGDSERDTTLKIPNVSSSALRGALSEGLPGLPEAWLPASVRAYIAAHGLYLRHPVRAQDPGEP